MVRFTIMVLFYISTHLAAMFLPIHTPIRNVTLGLSCPSDSLNGFGLIYLFGSLSWNGDNLTYWFAYFYWSIVIIDSLSRIELSQCSWLTPKIWYYFILWFDLEIWRSQYSWLTYLTWKFGLYGSLSLVWFSRLWWFDLSSWSPRS